MGFPNIDKTQGFLFSLPCISIYYYAFHLYNMYWFGYTPDMSLWSTRIFIIGATMHMMYVIPATEEGVLTFGAKALSKTWSDGIVFVPNLLHFTIHAFNFAILWGLTLAGSGGWVGRNHVNAEVFTHQMMPSYVRTTRMTKLGADADRATNAFLFWLFGWKNGEPHLVLMRFGFRLMLVDYLWITGIGAFNCLQVWTAQTAEQGAGRINSLLRSAVVAFATFVGL